MNRILTKKNEGKYTWFYIYGGVVASITRDNWRKYYVFFHHGFFGKEFLNYGSIHKTKGKAEREIAEIICSKLSAIIEEVKRDYKIE